MAHLRTLYKRTSTGAIQEWHKEVEGDKHRTISGQREGKLVTSAWTVCTPKNVGKANETSGEEQAMLEAEADYTKKLARGYFESVNDIDGGSLFKPMLAKDFHDYPITSFDHVFSQPKLDGARCIAKADGLYTRQGKIYESVPHISEDLALFFQTFPNAMLDGELYADKNVADFNTIMSLVRKKAPDSQRLADSKAAIQYHVYDYPTTGGRFEFRHRSILADSIIFGDSIVVVPTEKVRDHAHLDELNAKYLSEGYEGQMVRVGEESYENKRSKTLLKRKEFLDNEFRVISIAEGVGNRSGMAGFITYELGDGTDRTFKSGIRGSHAYCKELLRDAESYKGGTGTVRYFELTPDGIPRFPVTVALFKEERDV